MADARPHVVHVIHSLAVGGTENGLVNLVGALAGELQHTVVAMTVVGPLAARLPGHVEVIALDKRAGLDPGAVLRLARLLRRLRPDIVHSRNWGAFDAIAAAALARVPAVIHGEHGREVSDPQGLNPRRNRLRRWAAPFTSRFVTVSLDLARWLTGTVGVPVAKVVTIHNGVDARRFGDEDRAAARRALGVAPDTVVVGTVGRLDPVKDQGGLLDAYAALPPAGGRHTLVIVGDGPCRASLEARAARPDLAGRVRLLGERDDVAGLLAGFDIFTLPSIAEGISNTVLEAMASGLPVVATHTGGNPELIEDGVTGRLVPVGDRPALTGALAGYLADPHLRQIHGKVGRQRAIEEFSLDRMASRYHELYRVVTGGGEGLTMCGIAGIVHTDPGHPVSRELLSRMTTAIAHRGPDAGGFHFGRGVGLGHRRLSIIDLSTGDQPMFNEDRTVVVVFNGEIYNFSELRDELAARGHRFATRSDTEVIVHGYEEHGPDWVGRLRGMFAIALWDDRNRRLLLARDRAGKKPIYYAHDAEHLAFASELKGLLQDGGLKRAISAEALDDYLSFGCVPAPATILQGVAQVPPAHYLVWERGQVRLTEYWDVPCGPHVERTETRALEEFSAVFTEAVRVRLISDVPLGAFLSGGVDSTAVVEAMTRLSDRPVRTTAVGFTERQWNELPHARVVAEALRTDHHEVLVEARAAEILPRLVWHLDEPFADSSALPTYYVAKAARERVTVALSGDGGDEIFAGYQRRYGLNRWESRLRGSLPDWARAGVLGPLGRIYPKADWLPRPLRARYFLQNLGTTFERAYFADLSFLRPADKAALLHPEFRATLGGHDSFTDFARHFERVRHLDPLSQLLYVDFKTWLANDILVKVDRMSMASSLEVRAPLLDHKVVEFAASVSPEWKYRGRISKYLLKRHLDQRVPASAVYRPKQGFEIPLAAWLRGELREMAWDLLLSPRALGRGYVRAERVRALWERHQRGAGNHASPLWALLMLELWHRTFIDGAPSP